MREGCREIEDAEIAEGKWHLRRLRCAGSPDALVLCTPEGKVVPYQISTQVNSAALELPTITVTFAAHANALTIVDDEDE